MTRAKTQNRYTRAPVRSRGMLGGTEGGGSCNGGVLSD